MWCESCRSDVAAEVSADNRLVHCAICGGQISTALSNRALSRTQQARELLERWSRDRVDDPDIAATVQQPHHERIPERHATETYPIKTLQKSAVGEADRKSDRLKDVSDEHENEPGNPIPSQRFHPDANDGDSSALKSTVQTDPLDKPQVTDDDRRTGEEENLADNDARKPFESRRYDAGHAVSGPNVSFSRDVQSDGKPPTKWVPVVGQSLAYIGVLGLMLGTCLVILGYFRGPATYAPTGWLITMVGQMLLFLGVVTLVSSGMEETTKTVADRIDRLNEKLMWIEQSTNVLRGPRSEFGETDARKSSAAKKTDASQRQ